MESTKKQERIYFHQLKQKLRITVETKLEIRKDFKDWSGADIQSFQIDLEQSCQSTVSEKWVYLHFKNESEKIPRVDVLNLLSRYCGYKTWDDFKYQNKLEPEVKKKPKPKRGPLFLIPITLTMVGIFWWYAEPNYTMLGFKDAYTHELISPENLIVSFGKNKVSTKGGMLQLTIKESDTLRIDGAYYKPYEQTVEEPVNDTVWVELWPDDYALMLNYFSRAESDDWEKRQLQLDEAIHDEAKIFQSHPQHEGIEMLNKQEFIDRLILPVNSLKNLDIQHIQYREGKIYRLRFVQKIEDYENE